ncbi:hypothetical protein ABLU29_06390 [Lactococcus lactis]|uniref:DUF7339 family protein n=1 Tax=Lactococcus lactis TaxID=1358 RepID=UPI003877DA8C
MTPEYFWTKITDFCERKNMSMTRFCEVNQISIPVDSWRYCLRKKKFPPEKTIMNVKFLFSDDEIHELLCSNSYPVEVKPEDDVTGEIMLSLNLSSSYKADLRLRRKIQRLIYQGVL